MPSRIYSNMFCHSPVFEGGDVERADFGWHNRNIALRLYQFYHYPYKA